MEDEQTQTVSEFSSATSRNYDLTVGSMGSGSKVYHHFMIFLAKANAIARIMLFLLVLFSIFLCVDSSNHAKLFNKSDQYTTVSDIYYNHIIPLIYSNHVLRRPWTALITDCTDIATQTSKVHRKHRDKHRHSLCWRFGSGDCLSF